MKTLRYGTFSRRMTTTCFAVVSTYCFFETSALGITVSVIYRYLVVASVPADSGSTVYRQT